jgi:hypothetical protein
MEPRERGVECLNGLWALFCDLISQRFPAQVAQPAPTVGSARMHEALELVHPTSDLGARLGKLLVCHRAEVLAGLSDQLGNVFLSARIFDWQQSASKSQYGHSKPMPASWAG